jgi:hypothetical protein
VWGLLAQCVHRRVNSYSRTATRGQLLSHTYSRTATPCCPPQPPWQQQLALQQDDQNCVKSAARSLVHRNTAAAATATTPINNSRFHIRFLLPLSVELALDIFIHLISNGEWTTAEHCVIDSRNKPSVFRSEANQQASRQIL